ncbi:MAG: hypothetical protein LBF28_03135, partial [Rickettsiales bacterium]|nr:hypothetical protein [Rickettsiales bacterium]
MKTLLCASFLMPILMVAGNALAACSGGALEKVWDKTAGGYCRIFFPDCVKGKLGKKLSYSREYADDEIICAGRQGEYDAYYKAS